MAFCYILLLFTVFPLLHRIYHFSPPPFSSFFHLFLFSPSLLTLLSANLPLPLSLSLVLLLFLSLSSISFLPSFLPLPLFRSSPSFPSPSPDVRVCARVHPCLYACTRTRVYLPHSLYLRSLPKPCSNTTQTSAQNMPGPHPPVRREHADASHRERANLSAAPRAVHVSLKNEEGEGPLAWPSLPEAPTSDHAFKQITFADTLRQRPFSQTKGLSSAVLGRAIA